MQVQKRKSKSEEKRMQKYKEKKAKEEKNNTRVKRSTVCLYQEKCLLRKLETF